ncbi:hypothetical protein [Streptomyces sp. NPDC087437]|uniref:hypothetical protein n=1 Tax=Streptomyces sp. NPDC087437 TaxID=3365789 RepID=UPI00381858F6
MLALELSGEELQPDLGRFEFFGERGEVDAAAEALVLVDDEGDRDAGGAQFPRERDGPVQLLNEGVRGPDSPQIVS